MVLESSTRFRQNAVLTYWLLMLNVVYYLLSFFFKNWVFVWLSSGGAAAATAILRDSTQVFCYLTMVRIFDPRQKQVHARATRPPVTPLLSPPKWHVDSSSQPLRFQYWTVRCRFLWLHRPTGLRIWVARCPKVWRGRWSVRQRCGGTGAGVYEAVDYFISLPHPLPPSHPKINK